MTDLGDKIRDVMLNQVVPDDTPPETPIVYTIKRGATIDIEVDASGMGHTIIDGVDISAVTQRVEFDSSVLAGPNKAKITVTAMPIKLRAIAEVEIIDLHVIEPV